MEKDMVLLVTVLAVISTLPSMCKGSPLAWVVLPNLAFYLPTFSLTIALVSAIDKDLQIIQILNHKLRALLEVKNPENYLKAV